MLYERHYGCGHRRYDEIANVVFAFVVFILAEPAPALVLLHDMFVCDAPCSLDFGFPMFVFVEEPYPCYDVSHVSGDVRLAFGSARPLYEASSGRSDLFSSCKCFVHEGFVHLEYFGGYPCCSAPVYVG